MSWDARRARREGENWELGSSEVLSKARWARDVCWDASWEGGRRYEEAERAVESRRTDENFIGDS